MPVMLSFANAQLLHFVPQGGAGYFKDLRCLAGMAPAQFKNLDDVLAFSPVTYFRQWPQPVAFGDAFRKQVGRLQHRSR